MHRPAGTEVLAWLKDQRAEMLAALAALTRFESPSSEPSAQGAIRDHLAAEFERRGLRCRRLSGTASGGQLFAAPRQRSRRHPIQLLLGHYDTVWPLGTLADMPYREERDVVRGPGVYDMKWGIVQMLFALQALHHFRTVPILTPVVFLNSDEEIGSRESSRWITRLARVSTRVFVMEPSLGTDGRLKTTRKGIGRFTITVHGRAAHAGLDPEAGVSAILELSHVIQKMFALNDSARGITVNVGTIDGGLRPNVVAPISRAVADVRVRTAEDGERVRAAIFGLQPETPGIRLEFEGGFGRPALEATPRNQALWQLAHGLGREIGLELEQASAGGGSDGNTTSQHAATLDGLGAVGDGAHAASEHLDIERSIERAALLALLLMAPATAT
jgi:glutamate carboxypeptidase